MDEDITFGASVWGTSETVDILPINTTPLAPTSPQYGDFDDFGPSADSTQTDTEDDEFGDFGDFGDTELASPVEFGAEMGFGGALQIAGPSSRTEWHPLRLDPLPSRSDLEGTVNEILGPIWGDQDISQVTSGEGIREVEGAGQILVTQER